jgi:hypothetical protein
LWRGTCYRRAMPISSVVVTLSQDGVVAEAALSILSADPRWTLGAPNGRHVPAVLDTTSLEDAVSLTEDALRIDGVQFVDVVGVDFSDLSEQEAT